MSASVKALGYVILTSTDLDASRDFWSGLLGMMCAERTPERLRFRMDDYSWRIEVRAGDIDGVVAAGWDVGTAADLEELGKRLAGAGVQTTEVDRDEARARGVEAIIRFRDLDDLYDVELFWGQHNATPKYVSPTDARFVSQTMGVGHLAQAVSSAERYHHLMVDVLGLRLSDHITVAGGAAELEFLHCNPRHHSYAFVPSQPGTPPVGLLHLMVEVDDLDVIGRAYDRVLHEKAAPLRSTFGKHTNDKMLSFYVESPEGLGIEYGTGGLLIDDTTWLPTRYDAAHYWGHFKGKAAIPGEDD